MNHVSNLIIKYIMIGVISIIFLSLLLTPPIPLANTLIIALFVTGILYVIGDLFILPGSGNYAATAANIIMAALILWAASFFIIQNIPVSTAIITAIVIGAGEWVLHRFQQTKVPAGEEPGEEQPGEQ